MNLSSTCRVVFAGCFSIFLSAVSLYAAEVRLGWNPQEDPRVSGYNLYRSQGPNPFVRLNSQLIRENSYVDREIDLGKTYFYACTAVSSEGAESSFSNILTVPVEFPNSFPAALRELESEFLYDSFIAVTLLNNDLSTATIRLKQLSSTGEVSDQFEIKVPPKRQYSFQASGEQVSVAPPADTSWYSVEPDFRDLSGIAMIGNRGGSDLGAVSTELQQFKSSVLSPIREDPSCETILNFFNPSEQEEATVQMDLFQTDGTPAGSKRSTLPAGGSIQESLKNSFNRTESWFSGYIELESDSVVRAFGTLICEDRMIVVPSQALLPVSRLFAPHFFSDATNQADSRISLLNMDSSRAEVVIHAFSDTGEEQATLMYLLYPGELVALDLLAILPSTRLTTGYLQVDTSTPDGRPVSVIGSIEFRTKKAGTLIPFHRSGNFQSVFPQIRQSDEHGVFTGISLLNTGNQNAIVRLIAYDPDGMLQAEQELMLLPYQKIADVLNSEKIFGPQFSESTGHLQVSSDREIMAVEIIGHQQGEFLAAIPSNQPPVDQ